ncbi:MAG: Ribosomal small subunit methyltransferase [Pseudomonadota bacterium]
MSQVPPTGALWLVPGPLDFGCQDEATPAPLTEVLPEQTLRVAAGLTHWICENARSARALLKRIGQTHPLAAPLQAQDIQELPRNAHKKGDHDARQDDGAALRRLLAPALAGHDMGLLSEAGMPAVADPGSSVVRQAHALGIAVRPLVGPVSLLLTLAASGLNGQHFAFVGYLPQDPAARLTRLRQLEQLALKTGQTQLWIETPYRNAAMLASALQGLQAGTRLCVASGLTLAQAQIRSDTVARWRQAPAGPDLALPAVFALGA